tara:strand:- start:2338 stop:3105 length:768 start_codon:yes stop_codon:yes gene_type:complete
MFSYNPPKGFLSNKTILITGASDGIGKCCALKFANYGANLILLGRSTEKLEKIYDSIHTFNPDGVTIHPLDFSAASISDYTQVAKSIEDQYDRLDGLIHSAGMLGARCPIEHYPVDTWEQTFRVNTSSIFLLTKFLLPSLRRSDDARILFTSSSVGRKGRGNWGAYAVSKFAAEGLMQVLAKEVEKTSNIKVNSLNPGGIRTNIRKAAYPAENSESVPLPEILMPLYLYLFSKDSKGIHGEALEFKDFDPLTYTK